jgi:uroporphyrinogen decarboxylase
MNMTRRELVLASLRHEAPERVPAYVNNVVDWEPYASYYSVSSVPQLLDVLGNSIISFAPTYKPAGVDPDARTGALSVWGVPEYASLTYSDSVPRPLARAETVSDVEAFDWPDPADWDFDEMRGDLVAEGEHARMSSRWQPVFSRLCEVFGMEQALVNMYANRRVIESALDHIAAYYDAYFCTLLETCGDRIDIFALGDDFAGNTGLFIPPDLWRELFKPLYSRWIGMAKQRSLLTLMHSCGRIIDVVPDLIDIGLDAWETVQTHLPGQESSHLKKLYGRHIAFVGGIDTTHVLGRASPKEVREHVTTQIGILGENGGYICAPDHTIMSEVPVENVAALYETCSEFRRQGITAYSVSFPKQDVE